MGRGTLSSRQVRSDGGFSYNARTYRAKDKGGGCFGLVGKGITNKITFERGGGSDCVFPGHDPKVLLQAWGTSGDRFDGVVFY